jgi:hypothetical protein
MGEFTMATGEAAVAMGLSTEAQGIASFSMGWGTVAGGYSYYHTLGEAATAMGEGTTSNGVASTAMGYYTHAGGVDDSGYNTIKAATAMGEGTLATGEAATAMGFHTSAMVLAATSMGEGTYATGEASTAMGNSTKAYGQFSTAMGWGSTAGVTGNPDAYLGPMGDAAIAMGKNTIANDTATTAMGENTFATGEAATAMGFHTSANVLAATAMGWSTIATGEASVAMGTTTEAMPYASLVIGRYNDEGSLGTVDQWVSEEAAFVVGNGVGPSDLGDAFVVYKNGNVTASGTIEAGDIVVDGTSLVATGGQWPYGTGDYASSIHNGNAGNVGIGTAEPHQQLDVAQNIQIPNTIHMSGSQGSYQFGVIYKGSDPFIHNFNWGYGNGLTTAGLNTFVGVNAGNFSMGNNPGSVNDGSYNTGIGANALNGNGPGAWNTAVGTNALTRMALGSNDTAVGAYALTTDIGGSSNTAVGSHALYSSNYGAWNEAFGNEALYNNGSGNFNIALGGRALYNNTGGVGNIAIGNEALKNNNFTTGEGNTAIGNEAGRMLQIGKNNTFIGVQTGSLGQNDNQTTEVTNSTALGANGYTTASNQMAYGDGDITQHIFRSGKVNIVDGDLNIQGTGKGISINTATAGNATAGHSSLLISSGYVSTTAVKADSLIFLQCTNTTTEVASGVLGVLTVSSVEAGTGFKVESANPFDNSTFNWMIINQNSGAD